ncbi:PE domain-containing protein [Pseudomonas sp. RtIB026]|uniref:PE domain-containing protein n=1 Tax=Pseudomonas sp. RtIB026 TaxID=2749999 RepID=UPI003B63F34A
MIDPSRELGNATQSKQRRQFWQYHGQGGQQIDGIDHIAAPARLVHLLIAGNDEVSVGIAALALTQAQGFEQIAVELRAVFVRTVVDVVPG